MKNNRFLNKYFFTALLFTLAFGFLFEPHVLARSLRIGLLRAPLTLNYFQGTDTWSKRIIGLFHMPLYVRHPKTGEMLPWIAQSLPETSADRKEVIVRLKKSLWHDGSQVTADDICFTIDVIKKFKVPGFVEKWQMVKEVIPVDKTTVRFILAYPSAVFFNRTLFCSFVQKKSWAPVIQSKLEGGRSSQSILTGITPKNIISNGPFYIDKYDVPFYIVLKQNHNFFGKGSSMAGLSLGPHLAAIVLKFYKTTEEALVALKKGKIDFLWWEVPDDRLPELKETKGIKLFKTIRRGYDYLAFNLNKRPFNDKAFRQAVAYTVDREQLVSQALNGNGLPSISTVPACNRYWHNPNVWTPGKGLARKARISKAKEILEQAGYWWKRGKLMLPDGQEVKTVYMLTTCAGCKPHRFQAAVMIKRWCSDIGIPIELKMMNIEKILRNLRNGTFDTYLLGWSHLPEDPSYLETFFHSREAKKGGKNYPRYRNPVFDKLCEKADTEMDVKKRREIIFRMQDIIARDLPYITLYSKNRVEATRMEYFRGWVAQPGGIGNLWSFLNLRPIN